MRKLLSIILSITMLFSMTVVAFAEEMTTSGAKEVEGIIKVGVNAEFPPFEYMENDKIVGFDIDLMNYIAGRIGYGVEFVNMSFDKLIPAVINGEVDCAISAITATDERESVVDFTRPYLAANVTYKDGDATSEELEMYSIVFKDGVSKAHYKSSMPTDYEKLFMLVNGTIEELISDATVEKLVEKYELNKSTAETGYSYFIASEVPGDVEIGADSDTTIPAPSEWAAKDIDFAYAMGITDNNKQYIYQNNITREEFCELIYNLVTLVKWEITAPVTDSFTDTKNDKILMLNGLGIINGKSATEFAPDDSLTREEAATIIIRMINKIMPMEATEMWFEYDDIDEISEWASGSIQTISNLGFMNGVGNNRFAPKDIYTTEQAIATLVRVYRGAEAAGAIDHNSSIGIIGGADTPTEIYIGEDATVSDFYIEEAFKHTKKAGELAGTKEFVSMYIADDETKTTIENLSKTDFEKPAQMYYVSYNIDKVVEYYNKMIAEENPDEEIDIEKFIELNGFSLAYFATQINGRFGATTLAATTVLTSREGYIMPEDFENDFGIYLQYDGDYSALVTFNKIGEGVIEAHMQFVRNGEKADMLMFMSEIYDALGEESITIGKIK